MIYAIPHGRNTVANHFMKAQRFSLFDDENNLLQTLDNPAAGGDSSCKDKSATIKLLLQKKINAVIVRHIGERSLGKLLASGIRVFQLNEQTPVALATQAQLQELTQASQGRSSEKHKKKGGCSGHSDNHGESHNCGNGCGSHNAKSAAINLHSSNHTNKKPAIRSQLSGISSIRTIK